MKALGACAALLAACSGGSWEPDATPRSALHFDVVRSAQRVTLIARDPAMPDACSNPFLEVGGEDWETDALGCEIELAPWLRRIRLVRGGSGVDEWTWSPPEWPVFDAADGDQLVIETIDGDFETIDVPPAIDLAATIDGVVISGSTVDSDEYTVTWSAPGAASAIVTLAAGFGGNREHVPAGTDATVVGFRASTIVTLIVQPLAEPSTVTLDLGDAHLWRAGPSATRDLVEMPP